MHLVKVVKFKWSVNLRQTFFCIAKALDYVGIDDTNHGHRVGYMAYSCAKVLDWSEEDCQLIFALGLIHDCGVARKRDFYYLLETLQPINVRKHCHRGYELLSECPPLALLATPILYHHTPWEMLADIDISERDKRFASAIFLADRVDYLKELEPRDEFGNLTREARQKVCEEIERLSGTLFAPDLVSAMQKLLNKEFVWFSMEDHHIEHIGYNLSSVPYFEQSLQLKDVTAIGHLMANIVDAKSQFTFHHSQKVADLCRYLAEKMNLSQELQEALYVTGLVHDIGKLHTPEEILHKPGKLSESEYLCIQRHSTESRYILQMMFGDSPVCEWASNHHERINGTGYPRGLKGAQLDLPSRIVAVADFFQALTQVRPYRGRLPLDTVLDIMQKDVDLERIDSDVFGVLVANAQECYELSIDDDESPSK